MRLSRDEERELLRHVFDVGGGIPGKFVALTELPLIAVVLRDKGMVDLQRMSPDTWRIALTGKGSAWAHVHFVDNVGGR